MRIFSRIAAVVAGLLAFLMLALGSPNKDPFALAGLALIIGLGTAFVVRACTLFPSLWTAAARRVLHAIPPTRKFLRVPPAIQFLHAAALGTGFLSTAATLGGYKAAGHASMLLCIALLFSAGVVDIGTRGTWLIRRLWSDMLGKIFSVSFGAVLLALAIIKAKGWIHSVTHIDPKYLIESTAILAAVLLPVMYWLFGIFLLCVVAVLQMLGMVLFAFGTIIAGHLGTLTGQHWRERLRLLWYRLANGKRPPNDKVPNGLAVVLDDMSVFVRPISTVAVIFAFVMVYDALGRVAPQVQPYATSTLVALEYRQGGSCAGFENTLGVVYMEDGHVSVARRVGDRLAFSVEDCKFKTADESGTKISSL